jgi:hypothetical protein
MATTPRSQIPLKFEFLGRDGKVTQPWAFYLQTLNSVLPPPDVGGSGYVIDGTAGTTGPTTLYQGPAGSRGSAPANNAIYIATDTGQIFTVQSGLWQEQTPAFTGDVTKEAFSNALTLAIANSNPGTYGSGSMVPSITVDDKGRVTNVTLNPVSIALDPGFTGDLFYQNAAGDIVPTYGQVKYDTASQALYINGQITFADPAPTFKNLSPATVKGDLISNDGTDPAVLGVGPDGYVLTADSTTTTGLKWAPNTTQIEIPFQYGNASPKPLVIIPANKLVLSCSIRITEAFDGVGATLQVGSAATPYDVMEQTDNAPGVLSSWSVNPNTVYGTDTEIYLTLNMGAGATAGAGLLILSVQQ